MSEVLTVGSLFSGIGGFDLGLERAGMRTVWFCEQDPFCRRVLARHWPGVPCHPDVRRLRFWTAEDGEYDVVAPVDVLCGGFPCQDISLAGRGAGLAGERSGLWREFARLIGDLRPRYVIVENVPALTSRGLDVVLGDLAACGFDAEWDHLPASAFGAPHRRDRIWLVAYPSQQGLGINGTGRVRPERPSTTSVGEGLADADRSLGGSPRPAGEALPRPGEIERLGRRGSGVRGEGLAESDMGGMAARVSPWLDEPDVGRVAVGVPQRVDRLRALGNALVPQIAEWIGRQITEWESAPLTHVP